MPEGRAHRSFVSYIDKSREYYAVQGYTKPYMWAHHEEVPFNILRKPLFDCTIGVITTATLPAHWQNLPEGQSSPKKRPYAESCYPVPEVLYTKDLEWDKNTTHTDDLDTYLPLNRLQELKQSGLIGKLSSRFYGVPTSYSQRQTHESDAPEIFGWCKEDGVEIAILVPL